LRGPRKAKRGIIDPGEIGGAAPTDKVGTCRVFRDELRDLEAAGIIASGAPAAITVV
jgi:hypothetical protein